MRRMMGYGTVLIETAGLGFVEGQQRTAEGMVPMVERQDLGRIATTAAPHADVDPWSAQLNPAHPRSLYRSLAGATIRAGVFVALGMSFFSPIKWALLAILPIAWVGAWLDWAKQGWLVTDSAIVSRRGFFNRRTYIVSRDKLQSVHLVQGPLMRLHGLNRLVVSVAGSRIALPETGETRHRLATDGTQPLDASSLAEQPVHGPAAGQYAHKVRGEASRDRVADLRDTDGAKVHRQHVERGLRRAVHGRSNVTHERVWTVCLNELCSDPKRTGAAERPKQCEWENVSLECQRPA